MLAVRFYRNLLWMRLAPLAILLLISQLLLKGNGSRPWLRRIPPIDMKRKNMLV